LPKGELFMKIEITAIVNIISASAGLGTAAFGIVETMKSRSLIGEAGFSHIERLLGPLLKIAVKHAYGEGYSDMLRAQYKSDQRELRRSLRQGVRVGLKSENAKELAAFIGVIEENEMATFVDAAKKAILRGPPPDDSNGDKPQRELNDSERMLLARYEMAADGRIEAALAVAQTSYACTARTWAMCISMLIALVVGWIMGFNGEGHPERTYYIFNAILIGLLAVPVAPIAKDLTEAIKSVQSGLKRNP
jgi:hypothetical protein